ncbi:MAG TPA: MFS transporter [Caulobacteraceae bacterium]|nr:MFS transporter [Caulobacteraceae bacterium]
MSRFLATVYAFKFADAFIVIYPLYAVMFVDAGMTAGEVGAALAVWSVTAFVVEIPAGVWADRWSRRAILSLAQAIRLAGYTTWLVWPHFWGFVAGFVLWGVKSGLTSGCFEALVYDELKAAGREADYTRIVGRAEATQFVGILAASAAAAPLAPFGYRTLLIISIAAGAVAAAAPWAFPPAARAAHAGDIDYLGRLRLGLRQTLRTPAILGLVAFVSVVMALAGALDEFWSIFASRAGLSHSAVALFIAAVSAGQAAASFLAHRVRRLATGWFYVLFASGGALLALAAAIFQPAAVLLLVVFSGAFKAIDIVFEGRLQDAVPSETRATIGSVKGFAVEVAVTALYLTFGPLAQLAGYRGAFLATGASIAALGLGLAAWRLTRRAPSPRVSVDVDSSTSRR